MFMNLQENQDDAETTVTHEVQTEEEYDEFCSQTEEVQEAPRSGKWILFCMAGIVILAFLAIAAGLMINDNANDNAGEISFKTEISGTVRGELCAVGEDGSLYLRTNYGICRVGKNESSYEYNGWAVELDANLNVSSMAAYGDFLYLACGRNGMYRVNTSCSDGITKIIDDSVDFFLIVEDHLIYPSRSLSRIFIADLNGEGRRLLGGKPYWSTDMIYADGYIYYMDNADNLKRMRDDGLVGRVVAGRDQFSENFAGRRLYENGGILYLPSRWMYSGSAYGGGGIYAYDIERNELKKVTDAYVYPDAPIVFAGNALIYRNRWQNGTWHQIVNGKDTVYKSLLNDGKLLWMQAIGNEELIAYHEQNGYYAISFSNGKICSEEPIVMDYDTMPEVEFSETVF